VGTQAAASVSPRSTAAQLARARAGGLFSAPPVAVRASVIAANVPDQCAGC